ncbi:MAG: cupin domain-containing protein [Paludibacteraceae bacterium]|jgi:transcriptional regulator with XRE-family HTH domain|nr:cupin domain-containing protein [Paludibacteraceae bacterium]
MDKGKIIGDKIKNYRQDKNLTIEQVAEMSSLSVAQIQAIEEGKVMTSLTPLLKVSRALGVRLGTFLDDVQSQGPVVSRSGSRDSVVSYFSESSGRSLIYEALAASKCGRAMEPMIVTLHGDDTNEMVSNHEGEEFFYVLEGEIHVDYGKETFVLKKGDSIYFDSIVSHRVKVDSGKEAKALVVSYMP